jgi:HEAT repeat protein
MMRIIFAFCLIILVFADISCHPGEYTIQKNIRELVDAKKSGNTAKMNQAMQKVIALGKPAVPKLAEMLKSEDPDEVSLAQLALSRMGKPVEPELISILSSSNDPSLKKSVLAIFELQDAESAIPAVKSLLNDPNKEVRFKAAGFLYKYKRAEGLNFLKTSLDSPNSDDRIAAIQEIIRFSHLESRSILLQSLKDSSELVKMKAAEGLGNLPKDPACLEILNYVRINDRAWQVRLAAAKAVSKITGNATTYRNSEGAEIFPGPDE